MTVWHKVEQNIRKLPLDVPVLMAFRDGAYGVGNFTTVSSNSNPEYRFLIVNSNKYDNDDVIWPEYWMLIPTSFEE